MFRQNTLQMRTVDLHLRRQSQRGWYGFEDGPHAPGIAHFAPSAGQPDFGEQALQITDELVRSHAVDIVVIDSVAALTPKAELEGEMGDNHVAMQARMMSQALRRLNAQINQSGTIIIFINPDVGDAGWLAVGQDDTELLSQAVAMRRCGKTPPYLNLITSQHIFIISTMKKLFRYHRNCAC